MKLVAIVAVANNSVIGRNGNLPWHLPYDLAHFRRVTMGKPIVMGARTWRSIGRPLPGRLTIVLSRTEKPEGVLHADSLEAALQLPEVLSAKEVMIVGGAKVYESALPLCEEIWITRIHASFEGDTFFHFNPTGWEKIYAEYHPARGNNPYPFTIEHWQRTTLVF